MLFLYGTGTRLRGLFGDERPLLGEEFPSEIKEFRVVDWENCCCFWFMTIALRERADSTSPAQRDMQTMVTIITIIRSELLISIQLQQKKNEQKKGTHTNSCEREIDILGFH